MALNEACQLWIEQEIEEGLKEGKKPYSIGKEISAAIEKLFEAKIPPDTIRKRAERQEKKNSGQMSRRKVVKKKAPKESIFTEEFKQAFNQIMFAIQNAKKNRWKETTQEAILFHLKVLEQITTIS